jgi:hypothetical protein
LPTNISVAVQLFSVGVGRLETVLVGVVHGATRVPRCTRQVARG